MEERQDNTKNIKILRQRLKEDKVKDLVALAKQSQSKVNSITKVLSDKENELRRKANEVVVESEKVVEEKPASAEVATEAVQATPKKKTTKATKVEPAATSVVPEKEPERVETKVKVEEKVVKEEVAPAVAPVVAEEKPAKESAVQSSTEVKAEEPAPAEAPKKSILSFIVKKADPKADQKRDDRRPVREKGEKYPNANNGTRPPRPQGDRPANTNNRPAQGGAYKQGGQSTSSYSGVRPSMPKPQEIAFVPPKDNKPVKKKAERNYEEKHAVSKKSLIKALTV